MNAGLSIVMPAYNAEKWLKPTTERIYKALSHASWSVFEIIIVNDGSADHTLDVAKEVAASHPEVKVLTHTNMGRYLTRKEGVEAAKYDRILFIDTRVWIDETALFFLAHQLEKHPSRLIWNGHINVAKEGNIIARFGDAITLVGWRRYFKKPRLVSYGLEDFDHYPKGTTLFTCPRDILLDAMEWFEGATTDIKNSSDDTLLIRYLAEKQKIWISPEFSATYHARTTLRAFIRHSYFRGQYFVDGFLRPGTRFYYPLLTFLVCSPLFIVLCLLFPQILFAGPIIWLAGPLAGLVLGLTVKDSLSFFILVPVFLVAYGAGIWRVILRRAGL